jgi:hypothetical protein
VSRALALTLAVCTLFGCTTARSAYAPARSAPEELTLRYDSGFEIRSPKGLVAQGPGYYGLADFVRCVPDAERHARAAQKDGTGAYLLSGFSIGFAVAGLGGLSGLYYAQEAHRDEAAMVGLLVGGLVTELVAIALGAASMGAKTKAHGNALDAVNYYNDAKGFSGESCAQ